MPQCKSARGVLTFRKLVLQLKGGNGYSRWSPEFIPFEAG